MQTEKYVIILIGHTSSISNCLNQKRRKVIWKVYQIAWTGRGEKEEDRDNFEGPKFSHNQKETLLHRMLN